MVSSASDLTYNPRAMTNRSRRSAAERAEARRRARYAAQGREDELEDQEDDEAESRGGAEPRGSFLTRLFPPAPPLPGKPDPLTGFAYQGPLRGVMAGAYLLARQPVPWLGMGALWAVARLTLPFGDLITIFASILSFGALIAAGWIGWPRPWLFGLMASFVGILLYATIFGLLVGPAQDDFTTSDVMLGTASQEVVQLQPLFGLVAGWYGGYLRRRMAAAPSASAARRRR